MNNTHLQLFRIRHLLGYFLSRSRLACVLFSTFRIKKVKEFKKYATQRYHLHARMVITNKQMVESVIFSLPKKFCRLSHRSKRSFEPIYKRNTREISLSHSQCALLAHVYFIRVQKPQRSVVLLLLFLSLFFHRIKNNLI